MAKIKEKVYSIGAVSVGGRTGRVRSDDGTVNLELKTPGSPGSEGFANPEMLFAAGYAACFNGALGLAARLKRVTIGETVVKVTVSLGKDADGNFQLAAVIEAQVPETDQKTAEELVRDAHNICPYSRATRGNIEVELHAKAV